MHIGRQEWQQLQARTAPAAAHHASDHRPLKSLYHRLADGAPDGQARAEAAQFLHEAIAALDPAGADLPESPEGLADWMAANQQSVHTRYAAYREERRSGAPRRYFADRAHALSVLRSIAPTKLVDGAWLYGLLPHWRNPRLAQLVRTYIEELGEGALDKNHVVLYRGLLARYALDPLDDLDDALYRQGLVQLALGWNAEQFLPEVVGFNLGYEQLPLHLLVTAHELDELGLDPYYFTLHVTVDNADSGHARRACQAALDLLPRSGDARAFWRRMRAGSQLACAGLGTTAVIEAFDHDAEVLRILRQKARAGNGSHGDHCRVAGRSVNDWLADPDALPGFLAALQDTGWIRRGEPAEASRFWGLLAGERALMFGVFSAYELEVVRAWITQGCEQARRPTFRAALRNGLVAATAGDPGRLLDPDLQEWRQQVAAASEQEREALLLAAMSPARHWTPAGLEATRLFRRGMMG